MKLGKTLLTITSSAALSAAAHSSLVIYEGFEYANGTAIVGQGTGTGFGGNWVGITAGGAGTSNVVAGAGLTFGDLDVAGEAMYRNDRNGRGVAHRPITAGAQGDLTADGTTVWFSVIMDPTINTTGTGGQFGNTYATLVFGNQNLTDSSIGTQNGAGTDIANSGDAVGLGFFGGTTGFADTGIQGVTFTNGTIDQSDGASNSLVTGDTASLILGRIDWAANGSDDTISLFDVAGPSDFDPSTATAFSTMTLDVDQTGFDTLSIADGQTSGFDEIRFGTEIEDVLPGLTIVPEPSSAVLIGLAGIGLLRRRRR